MSSPIDSDDTWFTGPEYGGVAEGCVPFVTYPCGVPELCTSAGSTTISMAPCTSWNPTLTQACRNDAWAPLLDCSSVPAQPVLPLTGGSVPIARAGFAFVAVGCGLVALARRARTIRR